MYKKGKLFSLFSLPYQYLFLVFRVGPVVGV
jgi:hypothetical protein